LPELSWSTSPCPVRPVRVPPTVYFPSMLQPTIAATAPATIVHASIFTLCPQESVQIVRWDSGRLKTFHSFTALGPIV
jgi:hypothetical protein